MWVVRLLIAVYAALCLVALWLIPASAFGLSGAAGVSLLAPRNPAPRCRSDVGKHS